MASRVFIFLCPGCNRSHRNEPNETVCIACSEELRKLSTLYTRIVHKHKSLRKKSMADVLMRLWAWYETAPRSSPAEGGESKSEPR